MAQTATEIDGGVRTSRADILVELMKERRSCRGFLADAVSRETIKEMLGMAQHAASWCNSQVWQVIITEGEATETFRSALYRHASQLGWTDVKDRPEQPDFPFPERYAGVYDVRRREAGWGLYDSLGIRRGDRLASGQQLLQNFNFFGAPHIAIVTTERDLGVYGAVDSGGYVANLMLAATALGLATVAQAAIAGCADFVRDHFNIADNRMVLCGVSFGYADPAHPANGFRTSRATIDQVATFVAK